jgi:hypothetical protein
MYSPTFGPKFNASLTITDIQLSSTHPNSFVIDNQLLYFRQLRMKYSNDSNAKYYIPDGIGKMERMWKEKQLGNGSSQNTTSKTNIVVLPKKNSARALQTAPAIPADDSFGMIGAFNGIIVRNCKDFVINNQPYPCFKHSIEKGYWNFRDMKTGRVSTKVIKCYVNEGC